MSRALLFVGLLAASGCEISTSRPPLPQTLSELGVSAPIDTPAKLAQVMRAGRIQMNVVQKAGTLDDQLSLESQFENNVQNSAPLRRMFNADGIIAVLQPDPAGSASPAMHLVAVTDADRFAEAYFAGEETLLVRRAADFRSRNVSTLRVLALPGQLPRPEGGVLSSHSDYRDVNPPGWQHAGAVTQMSPPSGQTGYELFVYLGKWNFQYPNERITGGITTIQAQLYAREGDEEEINIGWAPEKEAAVQATISFDAFALDLSQIVTPPPPQNYGLRLLAQVPVDTYPSGARKPYVEGNRVAFGTGARPAEADDDIAYVVDVSNITAPVVTKVRGRAISGAGVALRMPYLYLPDEGSNGWLGAAPPYDALGTGNTLREMGGLQIYDLSAPTPQRVGFFRFTGLGTGGSSVALQNDFAYLFSSGLFEAVQILDVADPKLPVQREFFSVPNDYGKLVSPTDGYVENETLYVAWRDDGVRAYDVRNPIQPRELWALSPPGGPIFQVRPAGNLMLTTESNLGGPLRIFDISSRTATPKQLSTWRPHAGARIHTVEVDGNRAFVAAFTDGLYVLDISDPANPKEIGHWIPRWHDGFTKPTDHPRYLDEGVFGVAVSSQYIFVTDTEEGLLIFER